MAGSSGRTWLWRWRRNPLRRREDVLEAWLVPAVWLAVLTGGALAGTAAAQSVDHSLDGIRAQRHTVTAQLLKDSPQPVASDNGVTAYQVRAMVRWTSADGTWHAGLAQVDPNRKAGSRVTVWLNTAGHPVTPPPTASDAALQSELVGTGTGLVAGGVVYGAGRLVRLRIDRRRLAGWDREWNLVEPDWRRHMI